MIYTEGWIDKQSFEDILHYSNATGYEISNHQKPIEILRIRRVYSKPLKNYWFKSRNKIKNWMKIRIVVEEVR
jgi:hypothetical protein